jgi:hypothetical protein
MTMMIRNEILFYLYPSSHAFKGNPGKRSSLLLLALKLSSSELKDKELWYIVTIKNTDHLSLTLLGLERLSLIFMKESKSFAW